MPVYTIALAGFFALLAGSTSAGGVQRALSGAESCPIELPKDADWTEAETWTWKRLCRGEQALLNLQDEALHPCNPAKIEGDVPAHRRLSAHFVRLVLTHPDYAGVLARPQVRIYCALVEGRLDLENDFIALELALLSSHLPQGARFRGARFARSVSLSGSHLGGPLYAGSMQVGHNLHLEGGTSFDGIVDLNSATINGAVFAQGSIFRGRFLANHMQMGGSLFLRGGAIFASEVSLFQAKIGGSIDSSGSTFKGPFHADGMLVGGTLALRGAATFHARVRLVHVQVSRNFEADGSTFIGKIEADSMQIGGSLYLRDGGTFQNIDLSATEVGGNLQFGNSRFNGLVQLTGMSVDGEILLSSTEWYAPSWGQGAELILRNVSADALQAEMAAWQIEEGHWLPTDLTGFVYRRIGGRGAAEHSELTNMADATTDDLIGWIENSQPNHDARYDPQPYSQLAATLEAAGRTEAARELRFARVEHKRRAENTPFWEKVKLSFSRWVIGHGVYPFTALWWFVGLVVCGVLVASRSQAAALRGFGPKLWYSLENALPLVELKESHKGIAHGDAFVEGFFHAQKVLGFILATLLVGALTLLGG